MGVKYIMLKPLRLSDQRAEELVLTVLMLSRCIPGHRGAGVLGGGGRRTS
jgi:hypothetical protein